MEYWTTQTGEKIAIKDMTTSHIESCIAMLKRGMPDHEEDEYDYVDHWSLDGVVILEPGAKRFKNTIKSFEKELKRRSNQSAGEKNL